MILKSTPVFCLILFITFTSTITIFAATESELRARIEERNAEIKKLEAEITVYQQTLSETAQKSKTLQNEVYRIETQIKKLSTDIRVTENKIGATELEIEELDAGILQKNERIEQQRSALAETLQMVYREDSNSIVELLLKNGSLSDFFGALEDIQNFEQSIHEDLADLRELKEILEEERVSREERKGDLVRLQRELDARKYIEENAKGEKKTLLTVTKNEEARYQQLVAERAAKREAMLAEIQRTEDELRSLINPSHLPSARQGVLAWPLAGSILLTQSFGNTPDSKILYNGKPHNGIDFKASVGTPVYAAEAGVVREIGDTDAFPGCLSYGKWVLMEHPNNLATLYAHLSRIGAAKGQVVARSELIGYSGSTGYATGPHLHFTVYDVSTVQFRSSKISGSACNYLPYGGYLNPLAYL